MDFVTGGCLQVSPPTIHDGWSASCSSYNAMPMPEAAVDEDDRLVFREYDVGGRSGGAEVDG